MFIGLLGKTFAREPTALVKHIALILKAQKEKWRGRLEPFEHL